MAALAVADATVQLTRVTVLGRIAAHRLSASDSIMPDFAAVDDTQDGCVRFSAYAGGSVIPRQYESATIPPGAPIFTSDSYGQPGYAQLLETADAAITGGATGASISSGAENGSEMGAFSSGPEPGQGAGPAHQVRRVHAARAHARDRACHVIIVPPGAGGETAMAGDRARVSYDPSRKWRGVIAQQGRVTVEADWNEAATIDEERDRHGRRSTWSARSGRPTAATPSRPADQRRPHDRAGHALPRG